MKNILFKKNFWEKVKKLKNQKVFIVVIATKPDIIKQAPLLKELIKQKQKVILGHTGQHFDFNLSGGMLKEFDLKVDFNLQITGNLHQKTAQIIQRFGDILEKLKKLNILPLPIVHGDTTTSSACANAAWCNRLAVIHNEAGIRTLTPKKILFKKLLTYCNQDPESFAAKNNQILTWWIKAMKNKKNFERGSSEPFPEQFNTRTTESATGIFLAAHENNFLKEEGFPTDRIFIVGNCVTDATQKALKNSKNSKIFQKYPLLKKGFIRFCIHRRENCENKKRFQAIFKAMEILLNKGENILLISLFATEKAIDDFKLRKKIEKFKKMKNFIYSPPWPYYTDVIAAMQKAKVCVTDSGSMQEEMNEMSIPTVTLRFGSDRAETLFAESNILAPPINGDLIAALISKIIQEKLLQKAPKIYGKNVSKQCAKTILQVIKQENIFRSEEERLF